jgi:hypothetical protein
MGVARRRSRWWRGAIVLALGALGAAGVAVAAAVAQVDALPDYGRPGDTVRVTGTGFGLKDPVTLALAGSTTTVFPDGNGAFGTTLTVPQVTPGASSVVASQVCATCPPPQTTGFQILDSPTSVRPARSFVRVGAASVRVTGAGWRPQVAVRVFLAPNGQSPETPAITPKALGDGTLDARLPLAQAAPGGYTIVACVDCRGVDFTRDSYHASAPFTIRPALTFEVVPGHVLAGRRVTVSGSGFEPDSSLSLYLDTSPRTTLLDGGVNRQGTFRTRVQVPPSVAAGAYRVVVACDCSENGISDGLTVDPPPAPTLIVRPLSVVAGAKVHVHGTHWTPGTLVSLFLERRQLADLRRAFAQVPPNADGVIDGDVAIPDTTAAGSYVLGACQDCARPGVTTPLTIAAPPPPPAGRDWRWPLAAAAGAGVLLLVALVGLANPALAFRRRGWERRAEAEDRPEPCEHRSWYCKRGEPELELEHREVRELALEAATAGGPPVRIALEDEVVEEANEALAEWRASAPAAARLASAAVGASLVRSVEQHLVPAVAGLADVTLVVRVEGGEVSHSYHLRRCQRGDDRACRWIEKATWTVTAALKDARTYRTAVALRLDERRHVDEAARAALVRATADLVERIHRDHLLARLRPGAELELEIGDEE